MNYIGAVLYAFMSKDEIQAVADKDGPWNIPAVKTAMERCVIQWAQKGYFMPHPETNQDILGAFANGTGLIFPTGNWDIARLRELIGSKFEIGIFDWPSGTRGVKPSAVNFVGSGYLINAKTKSRQAAIDYVDFVLARPESAKVWFEVARKIPPYVKDIPGLQVDPLIAGVRAALANPQIQNYPGINMWLPPNAFDFMSSAGQKMLLGSMTSQGFIDGISKAYDTDRSNKATRATFTVSE
jgi:ABC-type glycerol-3-phosphate transport system substrate-binding protein